MDKVTVILTSCDRFDLLERTLDSFFSLNQYPIKAFHVHNDSVNPIPFCLINKYHQITWHSGVKRGLSGAIDYLITLVDTEYFFTMEDDWMFENNPNFIAESIAILNHTNCNQVWIRKESDTPHQMGTDVLDFNGIKYKIIPVWNGWCGFSFNPTVRRKSDWKNMFPNGIANTDEKVLNDMVIGSYKACILANHTVRHIGYSRHTHKFKI